MASIILASVASLHNRQLTTVNMYDVLAGSTAGYRCAANTLITEATDCKAAAGALGFTWIRGNAMSHYQDGWLPDIVQEIKVAVTP